MCQDALPLTLAWTYSQERVYDINSYERTRFLRIGKTEVKPARLTYWKRRQLLQHMKSLSDKEMAQVELQRAKEFREDRRNTERQIRRADGPRKLLARQILQRLRDRQRVARLEKAVLSKQCVDATLYGPSSVGS
jgi:hypothetical protein